MRIKRFEDLDVWKESRKLMNIVYEITSDSRFSKDFGLKEQIQKAAVSCMSNVAEGFDSDTNQQFIQMLTYTKRSASEVQSELYVALDRIYTSRKMFYQAYRQAETVRKLANGLIRYLRISNHKPANPLTRKLANPQTRRLADPQTVKQFLLSVICTAVTIAGCATTSPMAPPIAQSIWTSPQITPQVPQGIYHKVEQGETLWRIAKAYQVPIEELVRINRLPDATRIKKGQLIFIPGTVQPLKIEESSLISAATSSEGFIWPLQGKILSYFGSPKNQTINKGIDIVSGLGTPVKASRSGRVAFVEEKLKGLGKTLILDHGDGYQTVYGYLSEILVQPGQSVSQGAVIAKAGDSGRASAAGLHFQIRKNEKSLNPLYYLP